MVVAAVGHDLRKGLGDGLNPGVRSNVEVSSRDVKEEQDLKGNAYACLFLVHTCHGVTERGRLGVGLCSRWRCVRL